MKISLLKKTEYTIEHTINLNVHQNQEFTFVNKKNIAWEIEESKCFLFS